MDFESCFAQHESLLMEGALGERLKREYGLAPDEQVALAGHIYTSRGRKALKELWSGYAKIANRYALPFLATTPTRRANAERVARTGYGERIIADNVAFLRAIQKECRTEMYVGGMLGSRGDAYTGEGALTQEQAKAFHSWQIALFEKAGVDFLYAALMPTLPEALGMAQAMAEAGIVYIVSFTIQSNGRLIDHTPISEAIRTIDRSVGRPPVCYMANCVHPQIAYAALSQPMNRTGEVKRRFQGIQGNTSPLPYCQLDHSVQLKGTDPALFAQQTVKLREVAQIKIFGGCCGTDGRHIEQIAQRISAQTP